MKCELTTTPTKGSQYLDRDRKSKAGVAKPCDWKAVRTCPSCLRRLCSGHSRQLSTMGGKNPLGHHRCSHCGYTGKESTFGGVEA